MVIPSPAPRDDAELGAPSSPEDEAIERAAAREQYEASKLFAPRAGGRPPLPCSRCGREREGSRYVKVGGKKLRLCERCAKQAREWSGPGLKPDERRGKRRRSSGS